MASSGGAAAPIPAALRERVLERLGLARPPAADLEGLRALYGAWCLRVPFDNVRKMISLRTAGSAPLAGGSAAEFFRAWLEGGTGGTCWPGSNALFELVRSLGFDVERVAASMRDTGSPTHGTLRVAIDGAHWLVDSSLLTEIPLPLGPDVFIHRHPVYAAEVEFDGGTHVLWVDVPPSATFTPCRLLEYGVSHDYYLDRYERSRAQSPFNGIVYARRNRPDEMLILRGPVRLSKTAAGVASWELGRRDVCECLRDEIGISGAVVDAWIASGSLEASFEPYSGPTAAEEIRKPPSQR